MAAAANNAQAPTSVPAQAPPLVQAPPPPPPPPEAPQVAAFPTADGSDVRPLKSPTLQESLSGCSSTVELTRAALQSAPFNLDFAPLDSGDMLGAFDFDAFLNTDDSSAGPPMNFDLNASSGYGNPDGVEAGTDV